MSFRFLGVSNRNGAMFYMTIIPLGNREACINNLISQGTRGERFFKSIYFKNAFYRNYQNTDLEKLLF